MRHIACGTFLTKMQHTSMQSVRLSLGLAQTNSPLLTTKRSMFTILPTLSTGTATMTGKRTLTRAIGSVSKSPLEPRGFRSFVSWDSAIHRKFSTSTNTAAPGNETNKDSKTIVESKDTVERKLSFMELVSKYGGFILVTYTGVWATTGLFCFLGVNALGPEVAIDGLNSLGAGNFVDLSRLDPRVGNFAVAMVVNELLEPVRLPLYLTAIRPLCKRYDAWRQKRNPAGVSGEIGSEVPKKKNSVIELMKTYGPFGFVFYTSAWASTGVATYLIFRAMGPEAAIDGLKSIGIERFVDISHLDPAVGTLAAAVLVNELLEPVRLPLVLAALVPAHRAYEKLRLTRVPQPSKTLGDKP